MKITFMFLFLVLVVSFCVYAEDNFQRSSFNAGYGNGVDTAKDESRNWAICGLLFGPVGVSWAYIMEPKIPDQAINHCIGKPPSYVIGFVEGFESEAKKQHAISAFVGCLVETIILAVFINNGIIKF